jgi:hypothetical protein
MGALMLRSRPIRSMAAFRETALPQPVAQAQRDAPDRAPRSTGSSRRPDEASSPFFALSVFPVSLRGFQAYAPPGETILPGHEQGDLMQINLKRVQGVGRRCLSELVFAAARASLARLS